MVCLCLHPVRWNGGLDVTWAESTDAVVRVLGRLLNWCYRSNLQLHGVGATVADTRAKEQIANDITLKPC